MKVGIDIGGTKILLVRGEKQVNIPTPKNSKKDFYDTFSNLINENTKKNDFLGVCFPGVIKKEGVIKIAPNIPVINSTNIFKELQKRGIKKPKIENDANCFAISMAHKYKSKNLIGVIIGTGVGAGVIIEGKIYSGNQGLAGEVGHGKIFGKKEYEDLIGGKSFDSKKMSKKTLVDWHKNLAKLIAQVLTFYNPKIIVFGGGLTNILNLTVLKKEIKGLIDFEFLKEVELKKNKDSNAGAIGASLL